MSSFVALFATDSVSGRRDKGDKSEDLPYDSMDFRLLEYGLISTDFLIANIISLSLRFQRALFCIRKCRVFVAYSYAVKVVFVNRDITFMTMDAIQNYHHNKENRILKRNLWKFFKILRAQANPIYCLLEACPINFAWITIIDKSNPMNSKRIPISKFVGSLKKMPSTSKYYQLNILANEIIYINELSIENVKSVIADAIIKFESKQSNL